jgi:hypothetical protein
MIQKTVLKYRVIESMGLFFIGLPDKNEKPIAMCTSKKDAELVCQSLNVFYKEKR